MDCLIEVEHGRMERCSMAVGVFCKECNDSAEDIFPWLKTQEEREAACKESTVLCEQVKEASDVKYGRSSIAQSDRVLHHREEGNDLTMVLRGYPKAWWEMRNPGVSPEDLHMVPETVFCPYSKKEIDVFWGVHCYERRISSGFRTQHTQDCMPT